VDAVLHGWSLLELTPKDSSNTPPSRIVYGDIDPDVAAQARLPQQPSPDYRLAMAKYEADVDRGNRPRPSVRRG
jgi:hypothetical protein